MSAENSRLTRAIQRIAREDPDLRRAIDATQPRGDQPGGTGVGDSDADRDRLCCDGSTSGNTNPGAATRDSADGAAGLDADDPADLGDMAGCLSGVTDCATGTPVCWCGDDWIPPDGWDDATHAPFADGYEEGRYYYINSFKNDTASLSPQGAADAYSVIYPTQAPHCAKRSAGAPSGFTLYDSASPSLGECGRSLGQQSIQKVSCDNDFHDACNDDPPKESGWPEDGCVNLAIKSGSIVGSKYDPENDGSYSKPRKEMPLCDPNTGESILLRVDTTSTWKTIKRLDGDIDPDTGYGYLWDTASGRKIRQISPSEFRDDTV